MARGGQYVVVRIVPATNSADLLEMGPIGALTRAQLMRSMKFSPSLKPGIWGAVIGAAVISVLGFSLFGWTLDSTAEKMAKERALTAVVEVLAPICAERFQQQADAPAKLKEFGKASAWERRSIRLFLRWKVVKLKRAQNEIPAASGHNL